MNETFFSRCKLKKSAKFFNTYNFSFKDLTCFKVGYDRVKYLAEEAEKKAEIKENINQVLATFDTLLAKEKFTKSDIGMIAEKITVDSEKDITVELRSDISELLEMTGEPTV